MKHNEYDSIPRDAKGSRFKWRLLSALIVLALIGAMLMLSLGIGDRKDVLEARARTGIQESPPGVNVITLDLIPGAIRDRINLPGIVKPWVRLEVVTEVGGKVLRKAMNQGDTVHRNDLIAVLDSRDYRNAHAAAHASYLSAKAALDRMETLFAQSLATRSQLEAASAEVENLKARMDGAALNLERCRIQAPIDGVINHVYIEEGDYLGVFAPVCEILQLDPVKVTVGIPESDVVAVRKLTRFDIRIDALNGRTFTGEPSFLSRTADPVARLYTLEIRIPNPEGLILPDMFTRVEIVKEEKTDRIVAPLFAVISTDNGSVAFVEENGVARMRKVVLGIQEGAMVEIVSGAAPSERLVVVGQRIIADGQKLRVVRSVRSIGELSQ